MIGGRRRGGGGEWIGVDGDDKGGVVMGASGENGFGHPGDPEEAAEGEGADENGGPEDGAFLRSVGHIKTS